MDIKFKMGTLAVITGIAVATQVSAVQYNPGFDEDLNISPIDDHVIFNPGEVEDIELDNAEYYVYTKEDVGEAKKIYLYGVVPTAEQLRKYDLNKDNKINFADISIMNETME